MLSLNNAIIFIILLVFASQSCDGVDPLVNTKLGLIQGSKAQNGDYSMFLGIPFANVDEKNPFGPAEPYPKFEEIFVADDDTAICPQREEFNNTIVGNLNCLHLNIYVPNSASSNNRLPVLFWIYGGGFSIGFGGRYLYGPKYLVRHEIILVTINYRVGPYGFMCLDTPDYPGNQGLRDQLLALKWVNENIQAFGGNADDITIMGESAGGTSVDYHIRSDEEKLFNKAIMQSGNALVPGLTKSNNQDAYLKLSTTLGLETKNVNQAVSFLSTVNPKLLIAAVDEVKEVGVFVDNPFVVCVGKEFENVDSYVTAEPYAKDIKILIGFNKEEMRTFEYYADYPNVYLNELKNFSFNDEKLQEMIDIVKHFYLGDVVDEEYKSNTINFLSDFFFNHPTQRSIRSYLKNGIEEIYHYVFSYAGGRNYATLLNNVTGRAGHSDEIGYLFDISYFDEPGSEDELIIDRMTALWANFVKYGNPTPEATDLLPVQWVPITPQSPLYYLDIDRKLNLTTRPFHDRLAFWDLFYKAYEESLIH